MALAVVWKILPVFGVVAVGALIGRARPLPGGATRLLADYLIYIGIPALVAASLARTPLGAAEAAGVVGVAAAAVVGVGLAAVAAGRIVGLEARRFVLPAAVMNCGNLGYPVNRLAFGETGGQVAVLYYVTVTVLASTLGVAAVAAGGAGARLGKVARLPLVWAAAAGIGANLAGLGAAVPAAAETTAAAGSLPFLLFLLGHDVGGVRGAAWRAGAAVGAVRVVVGGAIGLVAAHAILGPGTVRSVAVVESAMPSAVMSYLLARKYAAAPDVAAASVVLTTAAAPVYLPLVILWIG